MNILLICKLANHTLTENILLPLINSGIIHHIYVLRDFEGEYKSEKVTYLVNGRSSKNKFRHLKKIQDGVIAVKNFKIDVIIGVFNIPHGYIGRAISIFTKKPYIHVSIAGHREFWRQGKLIEKLNLITFGKCSAITVTGTQTLKYLERKKIAKEKIFIIPNLPNEKFSLVEKQDNRHYDIVSFSRIDLNKNVILLIKALADLKDKYEIKVAIAGDGDQLDFIKKAASDLGVSHMIDFLGYINKFEDKVKILSDSKIFISCSKGEGFPVSLLEAMNCGCVPVVSNVGDIVDVIKQGINGFIFEDTDNEKEFVYYIAKLLDDEKMTSLMRKEAYKVQEQISIKNNGKIWNTILKYVTNR